MALSTLLRHMASSHARNTSKLLVTASATQPSLVRLIQTANVSPKSAQGWNLPPPQSVLSKAVLVRNIAATPAIRQMSGDHRLMWKMEKNLSVALLAVMPLALAVPHTALDDLFAISVVLHQHWGIESILVDYIRPLLFGNLAPKICIAILYVISAMTLGGLLYFNHNDIGISKLVRKIWTKKPE